MEEAEKIVNQEEIDEIEEVADPQEEQEVSEDTEEVTQEEDKGEESEVKKAWKNESNAKFAAERRAKERKEAEEKAYRRGIIDSLGGKNPYTNEPIEDDADVEEFLTMREIEKKGGDPTYDYAKYVKEKAREKAKETAKAQEEASKKEWFSNDLAAFIDKHPDVDVDKLIEDKAFQAFAEGKVGNKPLADIYDRYCAIFGNVEKKAQEKANKMFAKAKASPGSLSGGETKPLSYYEMSDEDFEKQILRAKRGELKK
ncbi:MAG: hypothetical protein IJ981_03155 [Clostridia bacterium]|nr:hypothetical protein [Clostridia bacterium]